MVLVVVSAQSSSSSSIVRSKVGTGACGSILELALLQEMSVILKRELN